MNPFHLIYSLLRWLIILLILLIIGLFFLLNSPAAILKLLSEPLAEQGISYSKLEGGLLTGFLLSDVNYKKQVKAKKVAVKVDFDLLAERVLYVEYLHLEEAQIDKGFLSELVDANSSEEEKNEENSTLPFDKVIVKELTFSLKDTGYQNYHVNYAKISVNNFETDMKSKHKGALKLFVNSNVSQVDIKAKIDNDKYELTGTLQGEQSFLNPILEQSELRVLSDPKFHIKAKGDMQGVNYRLKTKVLDLKFQAYEAQTKVLNISGYYDLNTSDVQAKIKADIDANVAKLTMDLNSFVNLNDINNSLTFDVEAFVNPKDKLLEDALIQEHLEAQKLQILALAKVVFLGKGNMKHLDFKTNISNLQIRKDEIDLDLKSLELKGESQVLKGDIKVALLSDFDSSVAKGNVVVDTKFNFNDLEKSLDFEAKVDLVAYDSYLNPLLKEHDIEIEGDTLVNVQALGNMEELKFKTRLSSNIIKEKIASNILLDTKDIVVNLKEEHIKGAFSLKSNASNLALNLQSNFSGNYMKPKELESNSKVEIRKFNAFGINLTEFMPLNAEVQTGINGGALTLLSKKLHINAKSSDYEQVTFEIKSEKIFPSKIMDLPKELKGKFVKLNLKGDAQLSKQYFSLKGLLEANKGFKLNVLGHSKEEGLDMNLFTKHFKLTAKGDINEKKIKTTIAIDSLKKVQKEFQALYTFKAVEVEGALKVQARLDGEKVNATVASKKLAFEAFSIENLDVNADYAKELITLNKLDFKTSGFEKEKLNQHYFLNKKGIIHLGEKRDVYLDMHPKILVKATGSSENLEALVQVESLALGHPNYGDFELSCDIAYKQRGKKKRIEGALFIDKMKLHYESKFLDPSQDNDVIVLSKKDKKKKEEDSFLEDTFIDLFIYASEANYKTRDIDLKFIVDVKAKKEFGKPLGIFGKVKEINGRVEQAPKLFTVVDSNIVFKGEKEINPLLDIEVEYELPDILITINIHGNAKRPQLSFTSEPPLPKKDILSYLLLGVSTANLGKGQGSLGREAQLFIMNQAARDLAYEVELDRVFVKDDGTGEGYAVQVGKKINDETMFVIENSTEGNSFILEYDVSKNIKIEVGQHQKTIPSQSIDIYFRKKFK